MEQACLNTDPIPYCGEKAADGPRLDPIISDRAYNITIRQLDNGFIVEVGCRSFAIESKDKLIQKLTEYLNDVSGVTKKFYETGIL